MAIHCLWPVTTYMPLWFMSLRCLKADFEHFRQPLQVGALRECKKGGVTAWQYIEVQVAGRNTPRMDKGEGCGARDDSPCFHHPSAQVLRGLEAKCIHKSFETVVERKEFCNGCSCEQVNLPLRQLNISTYSSLLSEPFWFLIVNKEFTWTTKMGLSLQCRMLPKRRSEVPFQMDFW